MEFVLERTQKHNKTAMDTATDVLAGNALPWEVSNLIVIVFIILLVLWAVRLCRVGLHLQDLRAGVNSDQVRQESHTHKLDAQTPSPPSLLL